MTRLLEEAFAAASGLPEADQNALALALLDELASEREIDGVISSRPDAPAFVGTCLGLPSSCISRGWRGLDLETSG